MESIGEQLKEVAFELALYETFYSQCKNIMNRTGSCIEKITMINSQIKLTEKLYKNHSEK